ncbi:MAG: hypothetical protein R3325_06600 [Thermoanaerobaculia bacterium]|nr:hypothetical protein [Thermoanaerobaculia bacterium]
MTFAPTAPSSRHRGSRSRQAGSAYLAALLALVVLSAIGLSVALVTQTEMQIGGNERTLQRVFYAADAGLSASTARALVEADYRGRTVTISDPESPAGFDLRHEIESSAFYPILDGPCNLCSINRAGTYEAEAYRRYNNAVTVAGRRVGGDGTLRFAERTLSSMIEVQPWRMGTEAYLVIDDPSELKRIKF